MKLTRSGFKSDELELSWKDLFLLALGRTLRTAGLEIRKK